jgi:hypothetical protein
VDVVAFERPPSFVAACLAAAGGHVLASFLAGLVMVPLALATWSGIVFPEILRPRASASSCRGYSFSARSRSSPRRSRGAASISSAQDG